MRNPRSSSRPIRGFDDIAPQTIDRYHLIDDSIPGIDENGKLVFDQNNGTPVPLNQIPDILTGKDADTTDGLHLPNTIANLLTDHDKANHDALDIDADSVDGYHASDLIRPVNMTFLADGSAVPWTIPNTTTELLGVTRYRSKSDCSLFSQARLLVNFVSGIVGSKLRAQYSLDQMLWEYLDGLAGPEVAYATGLVVSNWVNLAPAAHADIFLRIVALDGQLRDHSFGLIMLQFK